MKWLYIDHFVLLYWSTKYKFPANIYLLKVTNGNIRKRREICSKLTIKTIDLSHWQQNDLILILQFKMEKAHSEPCQISKTELFATIVSGWRPLTISVKSFNLDFRQGSEYASWCHSKAIKNLIKFECIQINIKTLLPQKKFKSFFLLGEMVRVFKFILDLTLIST